MVRLCDKSGASESGRLALLIVRLLAKHTAQPDPCFGGLNFPTSSSVAAGRREVQTTKTPFGKHPVVAKNLTISRASLPDSFS